MLHLKLLNQYLNTISRLSDKNKKLLALIISFFSLLSKDRRRTIYTNSFCLNVPYRPIQTFYNFYYSLFLLITFHIKEALPLKIKSNIPPELKKGGILISAHIGAYELGAIYLALRQIPCAAIIEDVPFWSNFLSKIREKYNIKVIKLGDVSGLLKAIKEKRVIFILGDRWIKGRKRIVNLFSCKRILPGGIDVLVRKFHLNLFWGYFVKKDNFFLCQIKKFENINDIDSIMFKIIKKYYTQWSVFQNGWKLPYSKN